MKYLYDSKGNHIANFLNDTLHTLSGENIAQYLSNYEVFFDMKGYYLGEIIQNYYLMYNKNSPCKDMRFEVYKDNGNIGSYEKRIMRESVNFSKSYKDVEIDKRSTAKENDLIKDVQDTSKA